jgi:opacity protein-like surface antigen
LHYGFGSEDFLGLPTGNLDVDTIKAGINYRF